MLLFLTPLAMPFVYRRWRPQRIVHGQSIQLNPSIRNPIIQVGDGIWNHYLPIFWYTPPLLTPHKDYTPTLQQSQIESVNLWAYIRDLIDI